MLAGKQEHLSLQIALYYAKARNHFHAHLLIEFENHPMLLSERVARERLKEEESAHRLMNLLN